jgi:DNA-directed RNA polymerase subunit RPC12/RpoP
MLPHDFAYPRVEWRPWPHGEPPVAETVAPDREMRCGDCSVRMFSSRAGELVASGYSCPHCATPMVLVPLTVS